jgi:hypothetical protein
MSIVFIRKILIFTQSVFYKGDGLTPGFFEDLRKATLKNMPAPLKMAYLKVAADKNHLQVMFEKDKNRMLQFKDWTKNDFGSIKAATLLIIGDRDIARTAHAVEMSHLIPQAELMIPTRKPRFFYRRSMHSKERQQNSGNDRCGD